MCWEAVTQHRSLLKPTTKHLSRFNVCFLQITLPEAIAWYCRSGTPWHLKLIWLRQMNRCGFVAWQPWFWFCHDMIIVLWWRQPLICYWRPTDYASYIWKYAGSKEYLLSACWLSALIWQLINNKLLLNVSKRLLLFIYKEHSVLIMLNDTPTLYKGKLKTKDNYIVYGIFEKLFPDFHFCFILEEYTSFFLVHPVNYAKVIKIRLHP